MTGEKNRYKTLDKMWKLDDEQLKTPKHDEMVLNLLNKNLIREILSDEIGNFILKVEEVYQEQIKRSKKFLEDEIKEKNDYINDLKNKIKEKQKEMEEDSFNVYLKHSIAQDEVYIKTAEEKISKITNECNERINSLNEECKLIESLSKNIPLNLISEDPIKASNGFLIGYWDLVVEIGDLKEVGLRINPNDLNYRFEKFESFYFEVKPKITSFGATLRQLRTYQSYLRPIEKDNIYLFTEDVRFKDAFESQGIKVISPPQRQSDLGDIF